MSIQLKNISKSYKSPVIKDLSYTFEPGKLYVIKGVSGCGKTTLLNIIGGIETDFQGELIEDSHSVKTFGGVGYIFQNSLLLSNITVRENLTLLNSDEKRVVALCRESGVEELMEKLPEQLSGGERQRIAVVRALLAQPKILLADEPTASLDDANSQNIAELIASLKYGGRTVIVATHEHYFDRLADEIIHLDYGVIGQVETLQPPAAEPLPTVQDEPDFTPTPVTKRSRMKLIAKRRPKLLSIGSLLPLALVFFIMLIVSTVQTNFTTQFSRIVNERYPMDLMFFETDTLKRYPYKNQVEIFDFYLAEDNGDNAYYLLKEKDSVFKIEGMVEHGKFPTEPTHILATREYVDKHMPGGDYAAAVGKKITFKGREFTISGVLTDLNESEAQSNLNGDNYYRRNIESNAIFIDYDVIKEFGTKVDVNFLQGVQDGYGKNTVAQMAYDIIDYGYSGASVFYQQIKEIQSTVDRITIALAFVMLVCFLISGIFLVSTIQTELFYRRRELGYLQIFGLSQKQIKKMLLDEYMLKFRASFWAAVATGSVVLLIASLFLRSLLMFNFIIVGVLTLLLFIVYRTAVKLSVRKFLKQSVISLIT